MTEAPLYISLYQTGALTMFDQRRIIELYEAAYREDFAMMFEVAPYEATHVYASQAGELVGHASWSDREMVIGTELTVRAAYIEGLAVHPRKQRQGIGGAIMARLASETQGYELRSFGAPLSPFCERLGWRRWQGPLAVRVSGGLQYTPQQTALILPTPLMPPLDHAALLTVEARNGPPW